MLNYIKGELHIRLEELFAEVAVDEASGDMTAYKSKLSKIVKIADVLGVETEINVINVNIKDLLIN